MAGLFRRSEKRKDTEPQAPEESSEQKDEEERPGGEPSVEGEGGEGEQTAKERYEARLKELEKAQSEILKELGFEDIVKLKKAAESSTGNAKRKELQRQAVTTLKEREESIRNKYYQETREEETRNLGSQEEKVGEILKRLDEI